jgi:uncharacterized membrane protein
MTTMFLIHLASVIGFIVLGAAKALLVLGLFLLIFGIMITLTELIVKEIDERVHSIDYYNIDARVYFAVAIIYVVLSIMLMNKILSWF